MNRIGSRKVGSTHEFERVSAQGFSDALNLLRETVDFCGASIFVLDPATGMVRCVAEHGEGAAFIDRINFENGAGLTAWVAQRRRLVHLPNIHRGSRHGQAPIRSYLSMPIYLDDEVVGVVNVAHLAPNAFSRHKFVIIHDFCDRLSRVMGVYLRRQNPVAAAGQRIPS